MALPSVVAKRFDKYMNEGSEHILYYEIGNFKESMVYVGGDRYEA